MFIDTSNMKFNANVDSLGRYWAIVRATELDTRTSSNKPNHECLLMNTFDTDKFIRIISCDSILKPVFVIPDVTSVSNDEYNMSYHSNQVIQIKQSKDWSNMSLQSKWLYLLS